MKALCFLFLYDYTFDVDNMFAYLMLKIKVGDRVDEIVDRVDVGMNALEALNLFANEETIRGGLLVICLLRIRR